MKEKEGQRVGSDIGDSMSILNTDLKNISEINDDCLKGEPGAQENSRFGSEREEMPPKTFGSIRIRRMSISFKFTAQRKELI